MGVPARVRVEFDEDAIALAVEGEDLGRLIWQRAATLFAIEDLTRAAVLHAFGGRMNRLTVDVGGYRAKRRAALEAFTREQVERVRATGRPVVLEPMSAADRKVVHDIVLDAEGVTSVSEGEEPRRSVVIRPA
jgi:spoIIIJ-associated protein